MKNDSFFKGLKFSLGFILIVSIFSIVVASGFHYADEILSGTFSGNYTFNGTVNFENSTMILGDPGFSCDSSATGALIYNNSNTTLQLCNGTEWENVLGSSGSGSGDLAISFSANQTLFNNSIGNITLTWTSTGVNNCTAIGDWNGTRNTSGSEEVRIVSDKNYILSCQNTETGVNVTIQELIDVTCDGGEQNFTFTGSDQYFVIPDGCTEMEVKIWGAGGSGRYNLPDNGNAEGGGGGFTIANVSVETGENYTIVVGQGGKDRNSSSTYGGGGAGGVGVPSSTNLGSSGGGRSAVRINSVDILTAGGGGSSSQDAIGGDGGGEGGGTTGNAGKGLVAPHGQGGTQVAGGAGGSSCGIAGNGGTGTQYNGGAGASPPVGVAGSGGGGGWYGGGGSCYSGAAGGGSGYCNGTGVTSCNTYEGNDINSGGNTDSDYISGIGTAGEGADGGNGRITIVYR